MGRTAARFVVGHGSIRAIKADLDGVTRNQPAQGEGIDAVPTLGLVVPAISPKSGIA